MIFNTQIWGEDGTTKILDYFKTLEWSGEIYTERKNFRIKLDEETSKEISKMYSNLVGK